MLVTEVFKQFTKERHVEDKGKNFNLLQEVYASTEFFDISLYNRDNDNAPKIKADINLTKYSASISNKLENFSLPFQNNFIKYKEDTFIFIREYTPDTITGAIYKVKDKSLGLNIPFEIGIEDESTLKIKFHEKVMSYILKTIEIDVVNKWYDFLKKENMINSLELLNEAKRKFNEEWTQKEEEIKINLFKTVILTCHALNSLNKKQVVADNYKAETGKQHTDYYRLKGKPTIKVPSRPIYYVLGEKNENVSHRITEIKSRGYTEFTHSFKVRGHWRRISNKSLGKDRNGNYEMHGFTWVNEYVKGEGELTKRLRVIRN